MAPRTFLDLVVGRETTLPPGKERDGMAAKTPALTSCRKPPSSSQSPQLSGQSSRHLVQRQLHRQPRPHWRNPLCS